MRRFVSRPITPAGDGFITEASGGEPPIPRAFVWNDRMLEIAAILRSRRTTKSDRGDGATIEVYYDREARRGSSSWWLYTISE